MKIMNSFKDGPRYDNTTGIYVTNYQDFRIIIRLNNVGELLSQSAIVLRVLYLL